MATTDVHEYGKVLIHSLLESLGITLVDAGVSVDPEVLAATALDAGADFIAISTYNGIARDFVRLLREALGEDGPSLPLFVGGKLKQIPEASNTSMPVDVTEELRDAGAIPCRGVEDMLCRLAVMAREKSGAGAL